MRYAATAGLGLVLGAALALALVYYNPLPAAQGVEPVAADWQLAYGFPLDGTLLLAHSGRVRLPIKPAGVADLWESTINKAFLQAVALSDADGSSVAVASRISMPSPDSGLLTRGVLLSDYWLLTVPGEGTLFIRADSNLWPFLKEALVPAWYFGREWSGGASYHPTVGPGFRNAAALEGVSGRFAGAHGTAVERYRIQQLTAGGGALIGELHFNVEDAVTAAD